MSNTVNVFETGIIGPCMSSMNYKKKNFKISMDKDFNITSLMKANNCKTLDELMEKEKNFNDKKFLEYLNSPEFKDKCKNINLNLSLSGE